MTEPEAQHLLEQLRKVSENSLYSAQAHFFDAKAAESARWQYIVIPALLGAVLALIAAFRPDIKWAAAVAAFLAAAAGIASSIGVDKDTAAHNSAGQALTVLRHEADRVASGFWREMTKAELYAETRRICDKYDQLTAVLIPTSDEGFAKATENIKKRTFEYDFKEGAPLPLTATKDASEK